MTDDLLARPNVYGTHISARRPTGPGSHAAETVRIVATYKHTGKVPNVVNLATRTPATQHLVCATATGPACGARFDHLRKDNLNVQETENICSKGRRPPSRGSIGRSTLGRALRAHQGDNSDILDSTVVQYESNAISPPDPPCSRPKCWRKRSATVVAPGVGMSILEISHRSKPFEDILAGAEADMRRSPGSPTAIACCFPGRRQPAVFEVPMNCCRRPVRRLHRYRSWSQKAVKEARRVAESRSPQRRKRPIHRVPAQSELTLDRTPRSSITRQQHDLRHRVPVSAGGRVGCRSSPNVLRHVRRPIEVSKPRSSTPAPEESRPPGVTLVIVRDAC